MVQLPEIRVNIWPYGAKASHCKEKRTAREPRAEYVLLIVQGRKRDAEWI